MYRRYDRIGYMTEVCAQVFPWDPESPFAVEKARREKRGEGKLRYPQAHGALHYYTASAASRYYYRMTESPDSRQSRV